MVNSSNKLPEEVVKVGSVHEFKGRLDRASPFVFGEDRVRIVKLKRLSKGKHLVNCFQFGGTERGFPVKNLDVQASRHRVFTQMGA